MQRKLWRTFWMAAWLSLSGWSTPWGSLWGALSVRIEGVPRDVERLLLPLTAPLAQESGLSPGLQRAQADAMADTLRQRLQSVGYLEAVVRAQPQIRSVLFEVELGKRFLVDRIRWEILESAQKPEEIAAWPEQVTRILLATQVGDWRERPLEVEPLTELQLGVAEALREEGYAFAEAQRLRLRADPLTERVNITLPLVLGPRVVIGEISIDGLERVEQEWVRQRLCFCTGELLRPLHLAETRERLLRSGLFNQVQMRLGTPEENSTLTPVIVSVQERKPRTLTAGITYATTEGVGGLLGWENRNLDGRGSRVAADLVLAQIIQELTLSGRRSALGRPDCQWLAFAIGRRKHVLSYLERSADLALLLEWERDRQLVMSAGLKLEGLVVRDSPENGDNFIGSLPFFLNWSDYDDPSRPRQGVGVQIRAAPTGATGRPSSLFFPIRVAASASLPLGKGSLAGRLTVGSIWGASLESIPLPLRFFEGSVDGLRGYAYQTVSPLDGCGIPIGGRSLVIANLELRAPITSSVEIIPFFDSGTVGAKPWPTGDERWRSAIGLGVRVDSLLGPLRLDVALPLNRRPCLDKPFSLYFGVGQTF